MTKQQTDAQIVAQYRQTIESCRAHYVGDWEATSIHIPAGDLDRIVALAALGLKFQAGRDGMILKSFGMGESDPLTAQLTFDESEAADVY